MPLVVVHYHPNIIPRDVILELANELPGIVADALNVRGNADAHLDSSDVEVQVRAFGEYDVNTRSLEIIVWANLYLERQANLEERKDNILNAVRDFLEDYNLNVSGFVWVLLQPAAFGEL